MTRLRIDQIRLDGGTQMRVGPRNPEALTDYKNAIQDGAHLPPVIVFHDGRDYWLADGFHRWSAHKELDLRDIEVDIREGTKRDAILYSVGANASHGLRRTNADKRRAVETLLKDAEWGAWSDSEIGRRAHVDHKTVAKVRAELAPILGNPKMEARTVQRGGTTFTQNTTNIGQRPAPQPEPVIKLVDADTGEVLEEGPGVEVLPPLPRPSPVESEPEAFRAEDLYIPFADQEEDRRTAEEIERDVRDIHNALNRLLKHERSGRSLLATPDPYTRSVRNLAHHAREMLSDWLDSSSERDSRTITIDALN